MQYIRLLALAAAILWSGAALGEVAVMEDDIPRIYGQQEIDERLIVPEALPEAAALNVETEIFDGNGEPLEVFCRADGLHFGAPWDFSLIDGITTFRGTNYRDGAAWGSIGREPSEMTEKWSVRIGGIDSWSGVGWTGQCAIVRWPAQTVRIMNVYEEKKQKSDLIEVIYATLDGKIYFLDLEDGSATRDPIVVGAPIKGSLSVDPRGYPLLYCGQGIDEVNGKGVKIGTRIFSLIDFSVLHFIDGHDKNAYRHWYAFDGSPLIDAATDTMLQTGENGVFYAVKLNTRYDPQAGTISIDPETVKYVYRSPVSTRPGMENSVAVYNHYAYFADNSGLLQCVDVNTMKLMWAFAAGDDTDASVALEEEADGDVALYTNCELDLRGGKGDCHMRRLNALTGEEVWRIDEPCRASEDSNGGAFATPAVGKGSLSEYVYFHVGRTSDGGALICADKETGRVVWRYGLTHYGWSSPVCVYSDSGRGYVAVGSSSGMLRLIDGASGELVCECDLKANIEGSPAVFGDTLVVGTRGCRIVAVKFN
jgi:outer membrane protein assembly factor BamB